MASYHTPLSQHFLRPPQASSGYPDSSLVPIYPPWERHCESGVFCPRTQHIDLARYGMWPLKTRVQCTSSKGTTFFTNLVNMYTQAFGSSVCTAKSDYVLLSVMWLHCWGFQLDSVQGYFSCYFQLVLWLQCFWRIFSNIQNIQMSFEASFLYITKFVIYSNTLGFCMNAMFLLLDSSQFNEDLTGLTNTNNKLWKNWAEVLLKNWNVSFKIVKTPSEFVLQV